MYHCFDVFNTCIIVLTPLTFVSLTQMPCAFCLEISLFFVCKPPENTCKIITNKSNGYHYSIFKLHILLFKTRDDGNRVTVQFLHWFRKSTNFITSFIYYVPFEQWEKKLHLTFNCDEERRRGGRMTSKTKFRPTTECATHQLLSNTHRTNEALFKITKIFLYKLDIV